MKMNFKINTLAVALMILVSCRNNEEITGPRDYRQEMRNLVIELSEYAKTRHTGFVMIPQNGIEIITNGEGSPLDPPNQAYLAAIDAHGQESLFYGYNNDDEATPAAENQWLRSFLDQSLGFGKAIFVIDYCSTATKVDDAIAQNLAAGYVPFAASDRNLRTIPAYPSPLPNENAGNITTLAGVRNFIFLINPENYTTKQEFIDAVTATNYDLIIMDLFLADSLEFTSFEIEALRAKANGGRRMVVCYMSIGEAEDYRWYWKPEWSAMKPSWIEASNPDWGGNYKVRYWDQRWKDILFGSGDAYLDRILNADFDGVYMDIIDGFEYFE